MPSLRRGVIQVTRVFLLGRLRAGVDPEAYERWVVERDYPFSRALAPIENFEVSRRTGFLFDTDGKLGARSDYAEIIDVTDLDEYLRVIGADAVVSWLPPGAGSEARMRMAASEILPKVG
jgi:3',5'-cyclic AMP phosphodiesterase CpdA